MSTIFLETEEKLTTLEKLIGGKKLKRNVKGGCLIKEILWYNNVKKMHSSRGKAHTVRQVSTDWKFPYLLIESRCIQ